MNIFLPIDLSIINLTYLQNNLVIATKEMDDSISIVFSTGEEATLHNIDLPELLSLLKMEQQK